MSTRYTTEMIKKIVEDHTNNEYSILQIDERGIINPKTGKASKRKMIIRHNSCGKCKGKVLRRYFAESIESYNESQFL